MGSPTIFSGSRTKLLTAKGLQLQDGTTIDNDGLINAIKNGKAEINTDGWTTFNDATNFTDGTGGSPTATWTASSTTPLRGAKSFLWTPGNQGDGVSYTFTPDVADLGSVMTFSCDILQGVNFTDNDLEIWIYDVTNSLAIQPSSYQVKKSLIQGKIVSQFQLPISTSSMRLSIYQKAVTASASTIQFDNMQLGPQSVARGAVITDWQAYTPTLTNFTASANISYWRRVGDSMEIFSKLTASTTVAGEIRVSLPSGYSIDTSKIASSGLQAYGSGAAGNASVNYQCNVFYGGPTTLRFSYDNASTFDATHPFTWTNTDTLSFVARIPIQGWSSNVVISSDNGDSRVVAANYQTNTAQAITTNTTVLFGVKNYDTHGAYNTSTGIYTVPTSGKYKIASRLLFVNSIYTAGDLVRIIVQKNGVGVANQYTTVQSTTNQFIAVSINTEVNLIAGDNIQIVSTNGRGSTNLSGTAVENEFTISLLQGPTTIAASESVYAKYVSVSGQTINNTATRVQFDSKVKDTHNAVTTGASWVFTAPISGNYTLKGRLSLNAAAQNSDFYATVMFNGTNVDQPYNYTQIPTGGSQIRQLNLSGEGYLLAGQQIYINAVNQAGDALSANGIWNWVSITRTGN